MDQVIQLKTNFTLKTGTCSFRYVSKKVSPEFNGVSRATATGRMCVDLQVKNLKRDRKKLLVLGVKKWQYLNNWKFKFRLLAS